MGESEELHAVRLGIVCENADYIHERLPEEDYERLYRNLTENRDAGSVLEEIGKRLELDGDHAWSGHASRSGIGDLARLERGRVEVRLVCPKKGGSPCARTVVWEPEADGEPPRCALTGDELRWDGDERIAD